MAKYCFCGRVGGGLSLVSEHSEESNRRDASHQQSLERLDGVPHGQYFTYFNITNKTRTCQESKQKIETVGKKIPAGCVPSGDLSVSVVDLTTRRVR